MDLYIFNKVLMVILPSFIALWALRLILKSSPPLVACSLLQEDRNVSSPRKLVEVGGLFIRASMLSLLIGSSFILTGCIDSGLPEVNERTLSFDNSSDSEDELLNEIYFNQQYQRHIARSPYNSRGFQNQQNDPCIGSGLACDPNYDPQNSTSGDPAGTPDDPKLGLSLEFDVKEGHDAMFGDIHLGDSKEATVYLVNNNDREVFITGSPSISAQFGVASAATILDSSCTDARLQIGERCHISFRMTFNRFNAFSRLSVNSWLNWHNNGKLKHVTDIPQHQLVFVNDTRKSMQFSWDGKDQGQLLFSNVRVGMSVNKTITLTRVKGGSARIDYISVSSSGNELRLLATGNTCNGKILHQGQSCQFVVEMKPTQAGLISYGLGGAMYYDYYGNFAHGNFRTGAIRMIAQ